MGLDVKQFRELIVRPTLIAINLWSESAEILLTGTAVVESRLNYIKQTIGSAVSIMQIEPGTYKDLRTKLTADYTKLCDRIKAALFMDTLPLDPDYLMGNLTAAVIFARLKYYFISEALPDAENWKELAEYHKKYYNSVLNKIELEKSEQIFKSVLLNVHYPY